MIIKKCLICENDFKISNYRIKVAKYCSRKCSNGVTKNNKGKLTGKNFDCSICGKSFYRPASLIKRGINKYCSSECWGKFLKQLFSDKTKHYRWENGKTAYLTQLRHSDKYKRWRGQIFERDNYTCQICNQRGGKLNADHIKPFAYFPKLRFDINNGRTLCIPCHKLTPTYLRHLGYKTIPNER